VRPIQLVPERDARPGATVRHVPTYEPGPCKGCPQVPVCQERGNRTVFLVREVRGKPLYCQKIRANLVACRAEHLPELEPRPAPQRAEPAATLLCDASVFINAERWQWKQCQLVLQRTGGHYELATTAPVREELHYAFKLPKLLRVIPVDLGRIHPRILELAQATRAYEDPTDAASLRDLSLVQALVEHPEIGGILTEDDDLRRLHPPSIVRELAGRETTLMTCEQFCRSKPGLFPEYAHA
jgi:hypothetical protein